MNDKGAPERDEVSRLLGFCQESREMAERIFQSLVVEKNREITVHGERIELTEEERGEFVEHFSAEIEPTLWESKRRKDQI